MAAVVVIVYNFTTKSNTLTKNIFIEHVNELTPELWAFVYCIYDHTFHLKIYNFICINTFIPYTSDRFKQVLKKDNVFFYPHLPSLIFFI